MVSYFQTSDLSPVACILTWSALNIVGGAKSIRVELEAKQDELIRRVHTEIDNLGVEQDGKGWMAKAFLYCLEVRCPQTGWVVPLLPTLIVSKSQVVAELVPDPIHKRYEIVIRSGCTKEEMKVAILGTLRTDGRGQDPYMIHTVGGSAYSLGEVTQYRRCRHGKGSSWCWRVIGRALQASEQSAVGAQLL